MKKLYFLGFIAIMALLCVGLTACDSRNRPVIDLKEDVKNVQTELPMSMPASELISVQYDETANFVNMVFELPTYDISYDEVKDDKPFFKAFLKAILSSRTLTGFLEMVRAAEATLNVQLRFTLDDKTVSRIKFKVDDDLIEYAIDYSKSDDDVMVDIRSLQLAALKKTIEALDKDCPVTVAEDIQCTGMKLNGRTLQIDFLVNDYGGSIADVDRKDVVEWSKSFINNIINMALPLKNLVKETKVRFKGNYSTDVVTITIAPSDL